LNVRQGVRMSKIEWCDVTWNPITGCTPISEGCQNCYAARMANRLQGRFGYPAKPNQFDVTVHTDKMQNPPKWRGGKKIFVCSMSDLFHDDVPTKGTYGRIFDAAYMSGYGKLMVKREPDIFMFLTKRPGRMADKIEYYRHRYGGNMPENIWLGVTAENQKRADERMPILLQIPAAVRFVSVEPMLGPVDLDKTCGSHHCWRAELDWVIAGPETGPGARPCDPKWIEDLYEQCKAAGVPFFDKRKTGWLAREFPA